MCGSRHDNGVGEEQRRQSGKGATHCVSCVTACHDVFSGVFHVFL